MSSSAIAGLLQEEIKTVQKSEVLKLIVSPVSSHSFSLVPTIVRVRLSFFFIE